MSLTSVAQAQQYITQGYGWVIDLDLEKFFAITTSRGSKWVSGNRNGCT
jgi:hypothetical protein